MSRRAATLTLDGLKLPDDFIYGCGTSAYQIEGAWNADGKGLSIWDKFAHEKGHDHVKNDDTGDVAMDFYHTYEDDLHLFKQSLGINNYDFTLSWTRLLPQGKGTEINEKGLKFYKNMIQKVHDGGMSASCTLYHWDLPQALQDEYQGWTSPKIVADFENYARVVMEALGGDCDRWISMNEPRTFCTEGYNTEVESAPAQKGPIDIMYKCMHYALLSHAHSYQVFQELKRVNKVRGNFGIKTDGGAALPLDASSQADREAVHRSNTFEFGWYLGPLGLGNYPQEMRDVLGTRLPTFTPAEQVLLRGSYDLVYYDGYTMQYAGAIKGACRESNEDANWPVCVVQTQTDANNKTIGEATGSDWNFRVPETLYNGMKVMHDQFKIKKIAIGETGMTLKDREKMTLLEQVNDHERIEWFKNSLRDVRRAIQEGFPLVGFVPWSCISNFEWSQGYEGDFGLIYSKPGLNQKRTPKLSSMFLRDVLLRGEPIDSKKYQKGGSARVQI
ncbi:hypothetical protein CBS101457_005511 [Exobasidium rhododendri]|nr:hypothetical protein CBS101457_005511 [Exobasidium rhododendri]